MNKYASPSIVIMVTDLDRKAETGLDGYHMIATVETVREAASALIGYATGLGDRSPAIGFDTCELVEDLEANAIGEYWHWITTPTAMSAGRDTRLAIKLSTPDTRRGN